MASSFKLLCTEHGKALKIQRFLNTLAPSQVLSPSQRGSSRRPQRGAYRSPGCICGHAVMPAQPPTSPGLHLSSFPLYASANPGRNCSSDQALLPMRLRALSILYVHCSAVVPGGGVSTMPLCFLG